MLYATRRWIATLQSSQNGMTLLILPSLPLKYSVKGRITNYQSQSPPVSSESQDY